MSSPWAAPVPAVREFRLHRCSARHRSYRAFVMCMYPQAAWVGGEGPYASLAFCRVLTVQLYDHLSDALAARALIDAAGCGGACVNDHEVVVLRHGSAAGSITSKENVT